MKKVVLTLLCLLCSLSQIYSARTTFRTSVYGVGHEVRRSIKSNIVGNVHNGSIQIINKTGTEGELVNAIQYAEVIFYNEMEKHLIDVAYLNAELQWGLSNDFESNELCKLDVVYDTEASYHKYHPHIVPYGVDNVLYPLALSLQSKGGTTENVLCMTIILNPDVSFYYGTDAKPGIDEYDMVTVLLRALTTGCGFQTTLNPTLLTIGQQIGNSTYINSLDVHIRNNNGNSIQDVRAGDITLKNFLCEKQVGIGDILLYNDWENGDWLDMSFRTLNFVSENIYTQAERDSNFIDLMDPYLPVGVAIHELTKYTLPVLQKIGWLFDVAVGEGNPAEENLYHSSITGSHILLPNIDYTFSISNHSVNVNSFRCELFTEDSIFVLATSSNFAFLPVHYNSLPKDQKWKRNPLTKNIIGRVVCNASVYNGLNIVKQSKTYAIEIPYVPDVPNVKKEETIVDDMIQLKLQAFANGSNKYIVQYKGYHDMIPYTDTIESETLIKEYNNIPANQTYRMQIKGVNSTGEGETFSMFLGVSEDVQLKMRTTCTGSTLWYSFYYGNDEVTDIDVAMVDIISRDGGFWTISSAKPRDIINLSVLPGGRGVYVIRVTLQDGRQFSDTFMKR